ncbi:MAG: fumarate hydratase C-terminal domain-containing protein [Kiritimatiellae bacterium]|nr:fumarate hydratase C-terminal domain-containing protein [Kiritimatiellia bacterium]
MTKLQYPFYESAIRSLKAGDPVSITGLIHTGRDKLHKYFADGGDLGVDFADGALYHCGPVVIEKDGEWKVVAAGPTTSVRENPYEPEFIAKTGVRIVIGKGGMDDATLEAMRKYGCVYIQAVGGAAALSAASVKRVAGVDLLDEFGAAEACWHFEVEDFPGIVAMDSHGTSLFESVRASSQEKLKAVFDKDSRS